MHLSVFPLISSSAWLFHSLPFHSFFASTPYFVSSHSLTICFPNNLHFIFTHFRMQLSLFAVLSILAFANAVPTPTKHVPRSMHNSSCSPCTLYTDTGIDPSRTLTSSSYRSSTWWWPRRRIPRIGLCFANRSSQPTRWTWSGRRYAFPIPYKHSYAQVRCTNILAAPGLGGIPGGLGGASGAGSTGSGLGGLGGLTGGLKERSSKETEDAKAKAMNFLRERADEAEKGMVNKN